MKIAIWTMRDIKMGSYKRPMVAHEPELVRGLHQVAQNPESDLNKYPTDFEIYEIGEFNTDTGIVNGFEKPEFKMNVTELHQRATGKKEE